MYTDNRKFPREMAIEHCKDFMAWLEKGDRIKAVDTITIAGSLRRGEKEVGDIELIIVPKFGKQPALFGDPMDISLFETVDLSDYGTVTKNGEKYKRVEIKTGIGYLGFDIFIVHNKEQYGYIHMLRTGPADFSKKMVTDKKFGGYKPHNYHVLDGFVRDDNGIIPVEREEKLFELWGMNYIHPYDRK